MPEGLVRDAILALPAWPDIAAAMGRLDAAGIDVARILTDAHRAGAAAVTAAAANSPGLAATSPAIALPLRLGQTGQGEHSVILTDRLARCTGSAGMVRP
ncbi:hypothetical protein [Streptomyces yangpuensis]|uniref:hypothetical protein n=1 Tax=Streptomyces yangpuensis TaxID=1648182 RepID=UPI00364F8196